MPLVIDTIIYLCYGLTLFSEIIVNCFQNCFEMRAMFVTYQPDIYIT